MEKSTEQETPVVIFAVMGATGTGKSTFINLLTNDDKIHVGHNQDSETFDIHMAHYTDQTTGRSVVLIDTPGFDDSREGVTDTDILEMIVQFLEPVHGEQRKLNGVIYMHRISDPRVGGGSRKNLRMFQSLCGEENLGNVRIVTTNWSRVSEQEGDYREADLKRGAFKALLDAGAQMHRHTNTIESAQQIMSELIPLHPVTLKIQTELRQGKKLAETAAGIVLTAEMREVQKRHEKDLASLKRELEEAAKAGDYTLRAELEQERDLLEKKMERASADRKKLETTLEETHAGMEEGEHGNLAALQTQTEQLKLHRQAAQTRIRDLENQERRLKEQMSNDSQPQVKGTMEQRRELDRTRIAPEERATFERLMEELASDRMILAQQVEDNERSLRMQEEQIRRKQLELVQLRHAEAEELENPRGRYLRELNIRRCLIC